MLLVLQKKSWQQHLLSYKTISHFLYTGSAVMKLLRY